MPRVMSITNSQSLLKLMSIKSVMPSNHLILCHPILPPSIFPSIRIFSNESVLHIRCPKCCSFSFSISPFKEYSGLISFRIDWLDLLAVQGTLKSLLQHHSSKASILRHSCAQRRGTCGQIPIKRRLWCRGKESTCQCRRQVRILGWEDPLGEEMATHSSILAWRIPWAEEPGSL